MLEFALVISLESVKCVEDSDVSSQRGCWRSESKNDVFGVGVGSGKFRFSPKKNRSAAHKPQDHHGLKTAGDKGAVDLSYLGMLWGGKGVGKAPSTRTAVSLRALGARRSAGEMAHKAGLQFFL